MTVLGSERFQWSRFIERVESHVRIGWPCWMTPLSRWIRDQNRFNINIITHTGSVLKQGLMPRMNYWCNVGLTSTVTDRFVSWQSDTIWCWDLTETPNGHFFVHHQWSKCNETSNLQLRAFPLQMSSRLRGTTKERMQPHISRFGIRENWVSLYNGN